MTGKLFYLVGASGSGKDSVLKAIRHNIRPTDKLHVAHRYITRPSDDSSENHIALSEAEFRQRKEFSCFAMHWKAHGLEYGIGNEIDGWLRSDLNVLVNGSREYLPKALERYPDMLPVNIFVLEQLLKERLIQRGRETSQEIEQRLQRSAILKNSFPAQTRMLNNSTSIERAANQFFSYLREQDNQS